MTLRDQGRLTRLKEPSAMTNPTGTPPEKVLFETACTYKRGAFNHNGQAVLTSRRLTFRPNRLELLAGASLKIGGAR